LSRPFTKLYKFGSEPGENGIIAFSSFVTFLDSYDRILLVKNRRIDIGEAHPSLL
jgi:hypothetical protein